MKLSWPIAVGLPRWAPSRSRFCCRDAARDRSAPGRQRQRRRVQRAAHERRATAVLAMVLDAVEGVACSSCERLTAAPRTRGRRTGVGHRSHLSGVAAFPRRQGRGDGGGVFAVLAPVALWLAGAAFRAGRVAHALHLGRIGRGDGRRSASRGRSMRRACRRRSRRDRGAASILYRHRANLLRAALAGTERPRRAAA